MLRFGLGGLIALGLAACAPQLPDAGSDILEKRADLSVPVSDVDAFHESIAVFDSHLDTPALFHTEAYDFKRRQTWEEDGTHVDLPRMNEGGLDGGFWRGRSRCSA